MIYLWLTLRHLLCIPSKDEMRAACTRCVCWQSLPGQLYARAESTWPVMGTVSGCGYEGQQKCHLWYLWALLDDSKHKEASFANFDWFVMLIYKLLRCLGVEIWRFSCQWTKPIPLPLVHVCMEKMTYICIPYLVLLQMMPFQLV